MPQNTTNTEPQVNRRGTDTDEFKDLQRKFDSLQERVSTIERSVIEVRTAFPLDDIEKPDFGGHRKDHVHRINAAKVMEGYKIDAAKRVIAIVVIFMAGLLFNGLADYILDSTRGMKK